MQYQKELKKVKILLGIGVAFTLFLFFGASADAEENIFEAMGNIISNEIFYLLCILLYPLGVVYNWRNMFGVATTPQDHTPADRYYTRMERTIHHNGNLMTRIMLIGLAVTLGWIPGVYFAFKNLHYLKKNQL